MRAPSPATGWRVLNTRDEAADGPLSRALTAAGLVPLACSVVETRPSPMPERLAHAVATLSSYGWLIVSSARGVGALAAAGLTTWPRGLRSAAVGPATARALVAVGADPAPIVGIGEGADALWSTLAAEAWAGVRVLVVTTTGGRVVVEDALRRAGALVDVVEAYHVAPRPAEAIRAAWATADADAVVVTSPRAAAVLVEAIGAEPLQAGVSVIAIGATTHDALRELGIAAHVPPHADFAAVARLAADLATRGVRS